MKRVPLYSQIRDYILDQIHQNTWRANDQLPTEADLAKQFGVSRFTIKKALSELVLEGLVYRIQGKGTYIAGTVGDQHDNSPQLAEVSGGALRPIVFLSPSIQTSLSSSILAGIEKQLSADGYQVLYRASRNEQDTERQILQECVRMGVKGVIIFPVDGESYSEEILRLALNQFPVVVIDRYLRGVDTNCVCSDHSGGAFDATSYLIEQGHSNVAFVAVHGRTTTSLEDRLTGYERALAKHSIPLDHQRCLYELLEDRQREDDPKETKAIVRSFLERNSEVTAVFAATTANGLAVMEAAEDLGIRVPEQLSVIFFDDYLYSSLSRIPPSCVVQQEQAIGEEAAKLLLSVMDNPLQERRKIVLPTRLVLRQSTASRSSRND